MLLQAASPSNQGSTGKYTASGRGTFCCQMSVDCYFTIISSETWFTQEVFPQFGLMSHDNAERLGRVNIDMRLINEDNVFSKFVGGDLGLCPV